MPNGAIHQLSVTRRRRSGVPGDLVNLQSTNYLSQILINADPQADEVWTLVIDNANDNTDYSVNLTDPATDEVTIDSGAGATTTTIATALETAWNLNALTRGIATAVATTNSIVFTGSYPGVSFDMTEGDSAADMTLTNTTSAAEADTVPFGRAMIMLAYESDEPDKLGILAASASLTAQVDTWTIVYQAGIEISAKITVDGVDYFTVPFAMATNLATVTAALDAAIDLAVPADSVIASNSATTTVITSELAGRAFTSKLIFGVGATTGVATLSSNASVATDFDLAFAGISRWSYDTSQLTADSESTEYAKNAGVEACMRGEIWVENSQTIVNQSDVYVELDGTGSDAGKFFNTASATRVKVSRDKLVWMRSDHSLSDSDVAAVSIHLGA